jgi:hypothetical protein
MALSYIQYIFLDKYGLNNIILYWEKPVPIRG